LQKADNTLHRVCNLPIETCPRWTWGLKGLDCRMEMKCCSLRVSFWLVVLVR
jgi:hypothetical protein